MTNTENANVHVQSIWLHLLATGGFHKVSEVRKALPDASTNLDRRLRDMVSTGQLVEREIGGIAHFGVTQQCRIPRALSVAKVMQAVEGKAP